MVIVLFERSLINGSFPQFIDSLTPEMEKHILSNLDTFFHIICNWKNLLYIKKFMDRFSLYDKKDKTGKPYVFKLLDLVEEDPKNKFTILAFFSLISGLNSVTDLNGDNIVAYAIRRDYKSSLLHLFRFVKEHHRNFNNDGENTIFLMARNSDPELNKSFWLSFEVSRHDLFSVYNNKGQNPLQVALSVDNHVFLSNALLALKQKSPDFTQDLNIIRSMGPKDKCFLVLNRYLNV